MPLSTQTSLIQRVAPEDIRVGDTIAVTYTRYQLVPGNLDADVCGKQVEPITIVARPSDAGEPKEVLAVCLPFVMVKCLAYGTREAIDTRSHFVARVDKAAVREQDKTKSKSKKGKRKKRKGEKAKRR